jgi:heme exporter protein C
LLGDAAFAWHCFFMASKSSVNEFLRLSRKATPVIFWASMLLILAAFVLAWLKQDGVNAGKQSDALITLQLLLVISTIIIWLALAFLSYFAIRRAEPLFAITCKAIAVPGVIFAFLAVIVGAFLAHQNNGIWWNWDGITTSMFALAIMLFGQVALDAAQKNSSTGGAQSPLIFILIATAVMPFILVSVFWWSSVNGHMEDPKIFQFAITSIAFYPAIIGTLMLIIAIALMRMRKILADIVIEAQMQGLQREAGA